ncbi:uncharacterized protein CIMG_06019 [Coccidioides immitis RS]|uniref:DNA polymerase alpha subunit B n=2 Tax=Coccidioides immitis TaxID=5501 RepID=A0A0E1RVR9_COCIM|nr:uncharacterized protein CIMG_06019 [Coccidioides immitis RS]EAS30540.2 hypothetical protein CIMG_06019 [Coccidioides immitis RS]KMU76186.1 hypothetical protein CISG_05554 [Coccidioides immitis RMSCC 3703]TPX23482.1 hypothetical protein DIZ76_012814 [Coccidioides immitis]
MSQLTAKTPHPPERTPEDAVALFKVIEDKFPSATLGDDRWYLIPIAALPGSGQPEFAIQLYTYLTSKPEYSTPEARQKLVRRLREALVKCVSIIGVCRPLEVIFGISKIERPEDKDYSFSREHWQSGPANHARGKAWLDRIYKHNILSINDALASHKDFAWISYEITYGLYLSDHSVIDDVETELVVLSGIMIQNLRSETHWHLRGTRRVGVSMEDVEKVHQCIELVAEFARVRVDKVPRVADIEHEV